LVGLKLERSLGSLKFGVDGSVVSATRSGSVCSACGEVFDAPLLAMVFSDYLVEEYYACPRCLSKVRSVERREPAEVEVAEEEVDSLGSGLEMEVEDAMKEFAVEEAGGCQHHLGYLKQRTKNTPIPEECLTCSKMIECMY
jgi:DNA-directed RNA polymerase subunit RPC12/RpoP